MKKINYLLLPLLLLSACTSNDDTQLELNVPENNAVYINVPDTTLVVNIETIKNVSTNYNSSKSASRAESKEIDKIIPINSENGTPLMYVVNYKKNAGFIIISATKDYLPILAHSDTGSFDVDGAKNLGTSVWLSDQKKIISKISEQPDSIKAKYRSQWTKYTSHKEVLNTLKSKSYNDVTNLIASSISSWEAQGYTVYQLSTYKNTSEFSSLPSEVQEQLLTLPSGYANRNYGGAETVSYVLVRNTEHATKYGPLLATSWNQTGGYAANTPNNYPAGCTAVAMGQVMKYYEYPSSFNWSEMANHYATTTTASFLAVIGNAIGIIYTIDGSSGTMAGIYDALKKYGYNSTLVNHDKNSVYRDLIKSRPVIMSGKDPNATVGHTWVCDGYNSTSYTYDIKLMCLEDCPDSVEPTCFNNPYSYSKANGSLETTYHMNWGWGGYYDGWYSEDFTLNTSSGSESYSTKRSDIIGINY